MIKHCKSRVNSVSRYPDIPPPGVLLAILSTILFGASTPLAKLVLGNGVSPWLLASLLYLGSGVGLAIVHGVRRMIGRGEAELRSFAPTCPGWRSSSCAGARSRRSC